MNDSIRDVDAQRERWRRYRAEQNLVDVSEEQFARGGLGGRVAQLDVRLQFLARDPEADLVPLNTETVAWLREERPSPWNGHPMPVASREGASSDACFAYDCWRDDRAWERYVAIHRHGGLELATTCAYPIRENRVFPLRQIVGRAWTLAAIQAEAIDKWHVPPPYEFAVAFRDTRGAVLGSFAEGWAEPHEGFRDFEGAVAEHMLIRCEYDETLDPEAFALDLGGRIENAFGTTHQRHLANRGQHEGRFDPRFGF